MRARWCRRAPPAAHRAPPLSPPTHTAEKRKCLYALFGQFGQVIDVVCMGTERLRGQAWVAFADLAAAAAALRALQGFPFFGRPLALGYARARSDAVARLEGTWGKDRAAARKRDAGGAEAGGAGRAADGGAAPPGGAAPGGAAPPVDVGAPAASLFVEGLPEATTAAMVTVLFKQFPGFAEVRPVPHRPTIAFVDFSTDAQAGVALSGLQGFRIDPQHALRLTYAKQG